MSVKRKGVYVNGESLAAGLSYCTPDLTRLKLAEGRRRLSSATELGNADEIMLKLSELNSDTKAREYSESVARKGKPEMIRRC